MRAVSRTAADALLFLLAVAPGCASPAPCGELPLGRWTGRGTYFYERWARSQTAPLKPQVESCSQAYPTSLTIRPSRLNGQEVLELEVQSDRGPITDLGDTSHLKVALVQAKRVSEATMLYRLVSFQFNPQPDEQAKLDTSAPPFAASCATRHGVTTFQIAFADNFVETFRFQGRELEKSGVFFDRDDGLIHWIEHLRRE